MLFWEAKTSRKELQEAEQTLLSLGFTSSLFPRPRVIVEDLHVSSHSEGYLHTLVVKADPSPASISRAPKPKLVILTGYGGGVALFYKCLSELAQSFDILAVDHLGTGLSGRPPFTATTNAEAVAFFVDAFEFWARAQGLLDPAAPPFYIMAHSMGAYLMLEFSRRHPGRVHQLIAIAPAGLTATKIEPDAATKPLSVAGAAFRLVRTLWDWGVTPGTLVRALGPYGRLPPQRYCADRFHGASEGERAAIANYLYHISAAPPSAEAALPLILKPQVWSPWNWEPRLHEVAHVPLTMIYTESDALDYREGRRAAELILGLRKGAGRAFPEHLRVYVIRHGGHFGFINSIDEFSAAMGQALRSPPGPGPAHVVPSPSLPGPEGKAAGTPAAGRRKGRRAKTPAEEEKAAPTPVPSRRKRGREVASIVNSMGAAAAEEYSEADLGGPTVVFVDGDNGRKKRTRRQMARDEVPSDAFMGGHSVFNDF